MNDVCILRAHHLDCRVTEHRWAFEEARGAEIDAYWRERAAANPALYDGRVLLANRVEQLEDEAGRATLRMSLFETRFSRFLAWRDFGFPDTGVYNCFAMAALRSREGAFLLGEMSPSHSSAGKLYFPAGTPDPSDVLADGRVDMEGSLLREFAEETGLDAGEGKFASGWTVVFERQRVACMKTVDSREASSAILARVRAFLAQEANPELSDALMVSRREQLADPRIPRFMTAFLETALPAEQSEFERKAR